MKFILLILDVVKSNYHITQEEHTHKKDLSVEKLFLLTKVM